MVSLLNESHCLDIVWLARDAAVCGCHCMDSIRLMRSLMCAVIYYLESANNCDMFVENDMKSL